MAREKKKSKVSKASKDAEYQYTDEALGEEFEPTAPTPAEVQIGGLKDKVSGLLNKKKLGVGLAAVVAIFVVYKFFSMNAPEPPVPAEKVLSQTTLTKPTAEEATPAPVKVTTTTTSVAKDLTTLPASTSEPNTQLETMQASMTQINQDMSQMQTALITLTNALIGLTDKVTILEKMQQRKVRNQRVIIYYVHSLLPERAWLHTGFTGGQFTTVKVGDSLPGYGKIDSIDPDTGVILTSSGREIRYGPKDS